MTLHVLGARQVKNQKCAKKFSDAKKEKTQMSKINKILGKVNNVNDRNTLAKGINIGLILAKN